MTTIESSKKDNRSFIAIQREQNKSLINLPPKKVMASKLAAAAAALSKTNRVPSYNNASMRQPAELNPSTKRKMADSSETTFQEKRATKLTTMKSNKTITHSEKIVQAEISQYKPYFEGNELDNIQPHVVLEYPGLIEPESYLLLRPVLKNNTGKEDDDDDKDEYNPITDLFQTCEFIYECYLTKQDKQLFGNQSYGIMRNLTKHRNRRCGLGFRQAVKEFNHMMKKLKDDGTLGRNAKEMGHPNYGLACHILFQVYSRTVARQAEALNNYQAFSNNVYGEINPSLVKEFVTKTDINSNSVFMDLGCGIGNVVLQVAAQTGCEAYGIEIMETPCKFAKRQLKEYAARMKAWRLPTGKIHFRHGDFLDVAANDLYPTLKRSDVLLVNNYAFDAATNQALAQLFLDLKEGTKIISLKSFVPKNHKINQRSINMPESILHVESFEYYSEAVSWTNNGGYYYIATVDRSRLKPFYEQMCQN
ncbi:histone methylation protein DOT1-domain-containing protein [Sporodiniella umbellata]|nr:histone methylation protein DOT1-domain-containing protein [Sporodiniella umbellata]